MKKITLWLFALFACVQIHAQVNLYSFSTGTSGVLDPMTGSTQLVASAIDDDASAVTNIGFSFTFAGTSYTQFSVNANGLMRLGSTAVGTSYSNTSANAGTNSPAIMPYWDDLATGTDGKVHYLLTGSAPNRKLIVEWFVRIPGNTSGAANAKFQCVLEETTNVIQFIYGNGVVANTLNSGATIGISTSSSLYNNVTVSTHTNTSSSFNTSNTSEITSGRTYTWTPPVACTGTPIGGTASPALQYICASSTPAAIAVTGSQGGMTGLTYQWEQSTDNGTTWANVVGGSGATTLSYTPAQNSATPAPLVQYRLKVSCSGNDGYSSIASVYSPVNPTGQVTNTTFTGVTQTGFTINWTNGNGNRRVVYMNTSSTFTDPTNTTGVVALTTAAYAVATGGQQLIFDGTGTSTTVTGLLPGVQYYVRVLEYVRCGAGSSYDSYFNVTDGTNVANITTTAPLALPWSEDIATIVTTTPVNWTNGTTWSFGTTTALNPALASNYMYKALTSSTSTANFITPYIASIPAGYRLVLDYKIANSSSPYAPPATGTGDFKIAISSDNGVTYTDVATVANNAVAGWQNYILDLAAYQGQVIRVKITATRISANYTIGFDNFKIEPVPACEGPLLSSLASSAITDVTATFAWSAPASAPANGYDYYVSTTNTAPANNATPTGSVAAGVTTANLTGLAPNTVHYVWVRAKCSSSDLSTWVGSINFKTECAAENAPTVVQSFTTYPPDCWKESKTALSSSSTLVSLDGAWGATTGFANAGTNPGFKINLYGGSLATPDIDWITSQPINLGSTAGLYRVKYKMAVTTYSATGSVSDLGTHKVQIVVSTDGGSTWSDTNIIKTYTGAASYSNTGAVETIDLTNFSGIVKIGFLATTTSSSPDIDFHIDDFIVEAIPTCIEPALATVTASAITATGADIGWTDPASVPAGYEYVVSTTNTAPTAAGTAASTGYVQLTGLTSNTIYYIYVRSVCSSSDVSPWVGPKSFKTNCAAEAAPTALQNFTTYLPSCWTEATGGLTSSATLTAADGAWGATTGFANAGTNPGFKINLYGGSSATPDNDWIISNPIDLGSTAGLYRVKYKMAVTSYNGTTAVADLGTHTVKVVVSTDGGATWSSTNVIKTYTGTGTYSNTGFDDVINLTGFSGVVKIGFLATTTSFSPDIDFHIDDFKVEAIPNCIEPASSTLAASAITSSGADIGWTDPSTVPAGYEYVISTTNAVPTAAGTAVSSGYVQLTGLTANTPYYVFVRSACSSVDFSPWVGPLSFTTLCSPVTTINENFDAVTTPALPSCWTSIVAGTGSASVTTSTTAASTPNGVSMYNSSSAATSNIMLVSPPISNLAAGTHRLKFKGKNGTATQDVEVGVMTNPSDASTFTVLQTVDLSTTFAEYIVNFTTYTGSAQHIAFRRLSTSTYTYVYLDDIIWEALPTVAPSCASGIVSTPNANCGNNPTAITWTAVTGADGYRISMGTTSGATNTLNNVDLGNVTSYNFVGSINQQYYFTIVPYNNIGDATGCTENTFTTVATGCYCEPTYTTGTSDGDLISNIVISGTTLANNTGTDTTGPSYTYYTGQPYYTGSLQAGSAYTVTVTVGSFSSQNVAAWIDYNDNYIFEDNERIGYTTSSIGSGGSASFTITLACNPPLGVHRMRIRDVYSTSGINISPCASYGWGETEDYNVTITTAAPCPVPSALTASAITTTGATLGWNIGCSETVWDVHVGAPNGGQPTTISNAAITTNPLVLTGLTANTAYEYYVRANCGGSNGESVWAGPFAFTTLANPPANDDCTNAVVLTPGINFTTNAVVGTNLAATASTGVTVPSCDVNYTGGDVWYSVVVPATGSITIETNSNSGSNISNTVMSVYSGTCGSLTEIGCDDDSSTDGYFSMVTLTAAANNITVGQTLYVRVWEYGNNAFGTFKVSAYDAALSNDTFDTSSFVAYPNPVKDVLNLSYTSTISNVKVVNLLGQQVINKTTNDKDVQVNMSDLPTGAYIVNITVEDKMHTIKVIKQ